MNPNKIIAFIVIVVIHIIFTDCAVANSKADMQYNFAKSMMKHKRYKTSITEFQRFLFLFPEDERNLDAHYQIGLAYQQQKQYDLAIEHFYKIFSNGTGKKIGILGAYALSNCYQIQKKYMMAKNVLELLLENTPQQDLQDELHYRLGWINIRFNQLGAAMIHLNAIKNVSAYPLDTVKHAIVTKNLPKKNPYLAGVLSTVPGLGQAYCGRYRDAALSFIVNGIIGWAAWENYDQHRPAMGTLVSFFGLGFYSGNIYGAINSAHKYNQRIENQWYYHLKQKPETNKRFGLNH